MFIRERSSGVRTLMDYGFICITDSQHFQVGFFESRLSTRRETFDKASIDDFICLTSVRANNSRVSKGGRTTCTRTTTIW